QDGDVLRSGDAQITVYALHRMEKYRRRAGRRERRCDLAGNESGLPHTRHDDPPMRAGHELHRTGELAVEALFELAQRFPFLPHHPATPLHEIGAHPLTSSESEMRAAT